LKKINVIKTLHHHCSNNQKTQKNKQTKQNKNRKKTQNSQAHLPTKKPEKTLGSINQKFNKVKLQLKKEIFQSYDISLHKLKLKK
jgi:hypothetical protein